MNTPIQEIKDRLDIVDFIRSYITLLPAGKNFKALCPFHKEKTPSFIVSPERQTWHCFGACSEGGDVFKFLMKYENLEFYEALKVLAEKAGVELKHISPAEQRQFGILYDINNAAKDFFRKELWKSRESLDYLKKRGLQKEIVEEFELGLAPDKFSPYGRSPEGRDALTVYLTKTGYNVADIERAGLNFKNDRGSYIDRFRGRLMFPIHNHFGKIVGFSGRIFPETQMDADDKQINADNISVNQRTNQRESAFAAPAAKYINSPETTIFNKSRILYGFHKTKNHIKEQQSAVLVEGQMDFLMLYQDGVKNAVATSGTALTIDHLRTLRRFADQLILAFDSDEAGIKAVERSIDLAHNFDFHTKILATNEFKDPAEAALQKPGLMAELIQKATSAMEFYFSRYLPEIHLDKSQNRTVNIRELKNRIRIILSKIKNLGSSIEQRYWLKNLSAKTNIDEKGLLEEMERIKTQTNADLTQTNAGSFPRKSASSQRESAISRRELISQRLFSLAISRRELHPRINEYVEYLPESYPIIWQSLTTGEKPQEERLIDILNLLTLRSTFELQFVEEELIEKEIQELLRQLRIEFLKEKRQVLCYSLKEAEAKKDEKGTTSLLKEINEVSKIIET